MIHTVFIDLELTGCATGELFFGLSFALVNHIDYLCAYKTLIVFKIWNRINNLNLPCSILRDRLSSPILSFNPA